MDEQLSDASVTAVHPDDVVSHVVDLMISEDRELSPWWTL